MGSGWKTVVVSSDHQTRNNPRSGLQKKDHDGKETTMISLKSAITIGLVIVAPPNANPRWRRGSGASGRPAPAMSADPHGRLRRLHSARSLDERCAGTVVADVQRLIRCVHRIRCDPAAPDVREKRRPGVKGAAPAIGDGSVARSLMGVGKPHCPSRRSPQRMWYRRPTYQSNSRTTVAP